VGENTTIIARNWASADRRAAADWMLDVEVPMT